MSELPRIHPTPPTPPIRPVRPAREVNRDRKRPRDESDRDASNDAERPADSGPDDEAAGEGIDIKA